MRKFKKILPALVAVILLLASTVGCNTKETTLNIFAAQSLRQALTEVNDLFMQQNSNVKIEPNFAGSGTLQQQIEEAFPGQVDVFISAAAAQMDNLQNKNFLLSNSRKNLLNNNIVLIVPKDSTWNISSFNDLANATGKTLAIGDPESVPAGTYAKEALELLGIWDKVQESTSVVLFPNVEYVLAAVETGNADVGIVYSTDALASDKVKVVAQGPTEINAKIVYPVAIIEGSNNQKVAQKYVDFLFSDEAKAIFEKYGFVIAAQ